MLVAVGVLLGAALIGDGYLRTRRADQQAAAVKTAVSTMSIQELARMSAQCDSERPAGNPASTLSESNSSESSLSGSTLSAKLPGTPATHDADYCLEVWREIEARPMQAVDPNALRGKEPD